MLYTSKSGAQGWSVFGNAPVLSWGCGVGQCVIALWDIVVPAAEPGNHWRNNAGAFLDGLAGGVALRHGWAVLQDVNGTYRLGVPINCLMLPLLEAISQAAGENDCTFDTQRAMACLAARGHRAVCQLEFNGSPHWTLIVGDEPRGPLVIPVTPTGPPEELVLPPKEEGGEERLRERWSFAYNGGTVSAVVPRGSQWGGGV